MLPGRAFPSGWVSRSDSSLVSVGVGMAGDAIGATEPLSTITTLSFPTVRRSMAVVEDSMTMELRADIKGSTTLVASVATTTLAASVAMKDPAALKLRAGRQDLAAATPVTTDLTAVRPSVGLQSRTPKPVARILAP